MPTVNFENFQDVPLTRAPMLDPGAYVVAIKSFEEKFSEDGKSYLEMIYDVKEGPKQKKDDGSGNFDPSGREIFDRVYLSANAAWRVKQLLVAGGILSKDDKTSPMAKGQDINLDLLMSAGPFKIKLTPRLYKDQGGNQKEARNVEFVV